MALAKGAAISLHHSDGTLLARYPHVDAMIGSKFTANPVHVGTLANSDHGTIRLISPIDGLDRLASARKLNDFPISIIATTTISAALTDWREQTRFLIAVAGLSVLVIASMLFLVVRKLSRQHQLEKHRLDTADQQHDAGPAAVRSIDSGSSSAISATSRCSALSTDVVKPGCTIRELLAHRKETGSFNGDVDEYCSTPVREIGGLERSRPSWRRPTAARSRSCNQPLGRRRMGRDP